MRTSDFTILPLTEVSVKSGEGQRSSRISRAPSMHLGSRPTPPTSRGQAETPRRQSGSWQPRRRVSWPCVQTGRIHTGPHSHLRYCHFAAGDRPAHERFGILVLTFWAGHLPLSHTLRRSRARESPPSFLLKVCRLLHAAITLVHGGTLQIDHWCGMMSQPNQSGCLHLYTSRTDHAGETEFTVPWGNCNRKTR